MILATSAGGSNGGYTVRAIFDDANNIIPGENVDVAAVKVGTVKAVEPTPSAKAAVVFSISNPGFQDFRSDATCTIRLQGLIGEKYVDCLPTEARPEGTPLAPPLKKIPSGHEGAGQYLLPVTNTHSPVGQDLLNDIQHLPERQRFTIIINELGAGLLDRGSDLSAVIRRANPALQELDKVLSILAGENKVLEELAVNSDKALKPFAAVRQHVAKFIAESTKTAVAGADARPRWRATWNCSRSSSKCWCRRWNGSAASPEPRPRRTRWSTSGPPRPASTRPSRASPPSRAARKSSSPTSDRPRSSRGRRCWRPSRCWRG